MEKISFFSRWGAIGVDTVFPLFVHFPCIDQKPISMEDKNERKKRDKLGRIEEAFVRAR